MKISNKPWGSISKTAEAYGGAEAFCEACLIDLNPPGEKKKASLCKLPVYEPDGALNVNGLVAAASMIHKTDAPLEVKRRAARKLARMYRMADMEPPESLRRLAGESNNS